MTQCLNGIVGTSDLIITSELFLFVFFFVCNILTFCSANLSPDLTFFAGNLFCFMICRKDFGLTLQPRFVFQWRCSPFQISSHLHWCVNEYLRACDIERGGEKEREREREREKERKNACMYKFAWKTSS